MQPISLPPSFFDDVDNELQSADGRIVTEAMLEDVLQRVGEHLMRAAGLDPSDLIVDVRLLEPFTDEAGDGA